MGWEGDSMKRETALEERLNDSDQSIQIGLVIVRMYGRSDAPTTTTGDDSRCQASCSDFGRFYSIKRERDDAALMFAMFATSDSGTQ
jgi:hypothetical protein